MTEETLSDIQEQVSKIRKYTTAEIRAMFEKSHEGLDFARSPYRTELYCNSAVEAKFCAYEQVFIDLGIWEE